MSTTGRYFKCVLLQQPIVYKLKLLYASRSRTFTKILSLSWLIARSYSRWLLKLFLKLEMTVNLPHLSWIPIHYSKIIPCYNKENYRLSIWKLSVWRPSFGELIKPSRKSRGWFQQSFFCYLEWKESDALIEFQLLLTLSRLNVKLICSVGIFLHLLIELTCS